MVRPYFTVAIVVTTDCHPSLAAESFADSVAGQSLSKALMQVVEKFESEHPTMHAEVKTNFFNPTTVKEDC